MSIENVARNRAVLLEQIGKAALNVQFPQEFELYVVALELVSASGKTLRYFIFPVMPSSIEEVRPELTNIKKTIGGISVVSDSSFVPKDINLAGTFGRKFRILLGEDFVEMTQSLKTGQKTLKEAAKDLFDVRAKTGYGCTKILQDIIEESKVVDEEGPRRLYFYNLALGNSYMVKPMNLRFSMSEQSNMIWQYSLQLKAVAPLDQILTDFKDQTKQLVITSYAQKQVNRIVNNLTRTIAQADTNLTNKLKDAIRL